MAGIVIRHAQWQRISPRPGFELGKKLGDVLALRGEFRGAPGVFRVIAKKMPVLFDIRAASSGVGDDGVDIRALEGVDGSPRECEGPGFFSCMHQERAAARLSSGRSD